MTDAEIDALTPEQLRKEVALRVMGLCFHKNKTTYGLTYACLDCGAKNLGRDVVVPDYPNDIAAAWAVVERLFPADVLSLDCIGWNGEFYWHARFGISNALGKADTATIAICRAALKAVERIT